MDRSARTARGKTYETDSFVDGLSDQADDTALSVSWDLLQDTAQCDFMMHVDEADDLGGEGSDSEDSFPDLKDKDDSLISPAYEDKSVRLTMTYHHQFMPLANQVL